jgi:hypothetical protein
MNVPNHKPLSIGGFIGILNNYRKDGCSPYITFFRGESKINKIKCGIGRNENQVIEQILAKEKNLFNEFINSEKLGYSIQEHPLKNDFAYAQTWQNLFQAQHLGFKTRLTDWTQCHFTALEFALSDRDMVTDGVIWVYKCPYIEEYIFNFNIEENKKKLELNPFDLDMTIMIKQYTFMDESYFNYEGEIRRFRQDGSFILNSQNDILTPFEENPKFNKYLEKITLSPALKRKLRENYLIADYNDYLYNKQDKEKANKFMALKEKIKLKNDSYF